MSRKFSVRCEVEETPRRDSPGSVGRYDVTHGEKTGSSRRHEATDQMNRHSRTHTPDRTPVTIRDRDKDRQSFTNNLYTYPGKKGKGLNGVESFLQFYF